MSKNYLIFKRTEKTNYPLDYTDKELFATA